VATKIPISGELTDPDIDTWTAVIKVLENAFVQAINPDLDGTVNMGNLSNTEQKLREEAKESKKAKRKEKREERKERREARKKERGDKVAAKK
jgi:hypothetical protein